MTSMYFTQEQDLLNELKQCSITETETDGLDRQQEILQHLLSSDWRHPPRRKRRHDLPPFSEVCRLSSIQSEPHPSSIESVDELDEVDIGDLVPMPELDEPSRQISCELEDLGQSHWLESVLEAVADPEDLSDLLHLVQEALNDNFIKQHI